MLPQTYLRLTTQCDLGTEMYTGRTDHDTTPNHPLSKEWGNIHAVLSLEGLNLFETELFFFYFSTSCI